MWFCVTLKKVEPDKLYINRNSVMWLVTKYRVEKSGPNHKQQNLTQSNQSNVKPTQFGTKV